VKRTHFGGYEFVGLMFQVFLPRKKEDIFCMAYTPLQMQIRGSNRLLEIHKR